MLSTLIPTAHRSRLVNNSRKLLAIDSKAGVERLQVQLQVTSPSRTVACAGMLMGAQRLNVNCEFEQFRTCSNTVVFHVNDDDRNPRANLNVEFETKLDWK
jgi:hypothetical protein